MRTSNIQRPTPNIEHRTSDASSRGRVRTRVFLLFLLVALGLGVAACKQKKNAAPPPPPIVQVVTVKPQDVPVYKEWIGTLAGYVNAEIRAQVSGYLISQDYNEGSELKAGQLLFRIDPRVYQAALDQAKAKLALDEAQQRQTQWNVERYAPLAKANAISQQQYVDAVQANLAAQAQVKADQAAVEAAELNIEFTKITSPIDGLAGVAQAQIGDLVGPSGPVLTTVSTINPIKVYFNVSEQEYTAYRRQYTNTVERTTHEQKVELELVLADGSTYPYPGRFYFAGRGVVPTTGTILVAGLFPNSSYLLRPGQFALVRAMTEVRKGVLLVPQQAVAQLQNGYQVATINAQNRARLQFVTVGEKVGSDWIIEKGLRSGEQVIVEGIQKVKDGMPVNPQPSAMRTSLLSAADQR